MSRSPLALDLGGPPPYRPVLRRDYFLQQHGGGGGGVHENHFEEHFGGEFANDLQLPDLSFGSSQSPSAGSAGSALSSDDVDLPFSVSSGSDVRPGHDFDHGYDYDSDGDSGSQRPSAASPPSPSRQVPFVLSLSASPVLSASASPSPDPLLDPDSAPAGPGFDSDSDFDLDSGQDTETAGPGSSPSSPNPDPLLDRPRHHLQSNDINDNFGLYWHGLPPRPARPARASLTPDIHPNRRLPAPPAHAHHHHHYHRAFALNDRPSPRPLRHSAHLDNHPSSPLANRRQSRPRSEHRPVSQRRHQPPSRNPNVVRPQANPAGHNRPSQRPHRYSHSRQQAALVEFQNLQDQHEEAHEDAPHHNNEEQDDFPLLEHLRLRRARRAARVAREAGRPRPARGNWGPFRPARRTAAEDFHESGQEDLDHSDSMDHDDELIEVVYQGPVAAPPTPPRRQQRHSRPQRQQRHHHHNHNHQGQNLMEVDLDLDLDLDMDQHVPVIDLTEEPDSPELQRHRPINILRHNSHNHNHNHAHNHSHNHSHNHIHIFDDDEEEEDGGIALYQPPRNPRRHMSQNGRMPSLNRSDGSILNGNAAAAVIDLTLDSPDDNIPADRRLPPPQAAAQLNQPANRNHRRLPAPASPAPAAAGAAPAHRVQYHDFGRHLIGSIRGLLPGLLAQAVNNPREAADVQFVGAVPAFPMNPNPLAGNPPEFNYQANGFGGYGGRQPTPKPDFQAPPPSRPGFTRDTRPDGGESSADEELVVVCPSCDNELKYSPDDEDDSPRPAKKPRGKKSQEEHHFWAVKNCGHVYCKNCYDNRKKHSKGKDSAAAKTGFRFQPSETSKSIKIFCAVDDCESEVSPNAAWVGIFM
ncbi:hypothetical protein FJTKL_12142 [Diaporthe vaccinii]|uniref:Cell cycle control protein n=1 Tax=Diaporthe vaccinii TaxID=105482 RepID=A0ABR4EFH5_9PEZI